METWSYLPVTNFPSNKMVIPTALFYTPLILIVLLGCFVIQREPYLPASRLPFVLRKLHPDFLQDNVHPVIGLKPRQDVMTLIVQYFNVDTFKP